MSEKQESKSIVKHQNFDDIVAALTDFSERAAHKHTALEKVEPHRRLLGKSKTPTIDDINKVVDGIDDQLINLKTFNVEVLNVLTGVVVALSALDKEHISGILITANLAKEASEQAVNNVKSISAIILILKSQKHLKDIDQSWEDLEKQKELIKTLSEHKDEILKIKHLKDVDKLWADVGTQGKSIEEIDKSVNEIAKILKSQGDTVSVLNGKLREMSEKQRAFIDATNQHLADHQKKIDQSLEDREKALQDSLTLLNEHSKNSLETIEKKATELSKAQADALESIDKNQSEKICQLESTLAERLNAIETAQNEKFTHIGNEQARALKNIESTQTERLEQISKEQTESFDRLSNEQDKKLEEINKSLEEEKCSLNQTVADLTHKIKIAYMIAGGASAITVIHVLLNVLGVL